MQRQQIRHDEANIQVQLAASVVKARQPSRAASTRSGGAEHEHRQQGAIKALVQIPRWPTSSTHKEHHGSPGLLEV